LTGAPSCTHELQAIDLFLSSCPEKDRMVFILICVPSREKVAAYHDLLKTIESQVGQINGRYATVQSISCTNPSGSRSYAPCIRLPTWRWLRRCETA
jgi:trehalose-6-phosphate synthase